MFGDLRESKLRFATLYAIAAIFLPFGQALGDTTDWSLAPGGLYTSGGSFGSTLTGTNVPSLSVTGDGTPSHNGSSLLIVDGFLNFTSGVYNGNGSNWSWGAGGVLNLTGCIVGVTATACTGSNDITLLSDDFQSVQIKPVLGSLDVVFGNITGTLNPQVAQYFGVSTTFDVASFSTSILTSGHPGSSLHGSNVLGLVQAAPAQINVPEYWSFLDSISFFGLALISLACMLHFRILRFAAR